MHDDFLTKLSRSRSQNSVGDLSTTPERCKTRTRWQVRSPALRLREANRSVSLERFRVSLLVCFSVERIDQQGVTLDARVDIGDLGVVGHQFQQPYLREMIGVGGVGIASNTKADASWIKNLLAQDFYRAVLLKAEDNRQGDFCVALKYAKSAQTLFPLIGFRDPLQGPPTEDLIKDLRTRLGES